MVVLSLTQGCAALMIGGSAVSTIFDRYEKHQIKKKIEDLKKELDKEKWMYYVVGFYATCCLIALLAMG